MDASLWLDSAFKWPTWFSEINDPFLQCKSLSLTFGEEAVHYLESCIEKFLEKKNAQEVDDFKKVVHALPQQHHQTYKSCFSMYLAEKDVKEQQKWLNVGLIVRDPDCLFKMACKEEGRRSVELLTKASKQGHAGARELLSFEKTKYLGAYTVSSSDQHLLPIFIDEFPYSMKVFFSQDNRPPVYSRYMRNVGIPAEGTDYAIWLKRAFVDETDGGWTPACQVYAYPYFGFWLAILFENGHLNIIEKSTSMCLEILNNCHKHSRSETAGMALYRLGFLYFHGTAEISVDKRKALEFWEKGHLRDHRPSTCVLAYCYLHGHGTETNHVNAFKLLSSSNDVYSCYYLASCYQNGFGVKQDSANAKVCYDTAMTHRSESRPREHIEFAKLVNVGSSYEQANAIIQSTYRTCKLMRDKQAKDSSGCLIC